jgi:hypothetical protein
VSEAELCPHAGCPAQGPHTHDAIYGAVMYDPTSTRRLYLTELKEVIAYNARQVTKPRFDRYRSSALRPNVPAATTHRRYP